ncbi:segregation/condensation protein A [Streptomyces populi]|uniref:Segregation and condensation protein A n=1 Tax=Streptomyces populi TaxID=2058924 RepID=A0A2I0SL16_9ACTN|nr:segregation/condensation protein A [Streptomyces populi]PKT70622.1 segregation/condensation protein A [Streptomyces populi]
MTSNVPPPSAASGGRRRVLGRGPGTAPAPPGAAEPSGPPAPVAPARPPGTAAEPSGPDEGARAPGPARKAGTGSARTVEPPSTPAEPFEAPVEGPAGPARPSGPVEPPEAPQGGPAASTDPGPDSGARAVPGVPGGTTEAGEAAGASGEGLEGGPGDSRAGGVFTVRLSNFEGPFDLLLQLISKHKLDVTEVALSKVTDEFMAHIRAMGPDWDLDRTTEFLVVAATLLDLKTARLLPAAEVEDEADLALLEARDLLFARLLQYRAYKQIADIFNARLAEESRRYPRTVGLEAQYAELLPEVVISIGAEGLAKLAVKAMQPKPKPQVYVDHIHAPLVSVQEQAGIVVARLRELGEASFRSLVEDTDDALTVVARFLALLELYREKAVALDQEEALGALMVRWTGGEGDEGPRVTDEFDRPAEAVKDGAGRGSEKEKA